jgi:hypothetical protein
MGTRSNTVIYDENVNQIVNMARQHDGYLTGHGLELLKFLEPIEIVNGFTMGKTNLANGAGCLAAQMIAYFKVGVGDFYIMPHVVNMDYDNDFTYTVTVRSDDSIHVMVHEFGDHLFDGTVAEYKKFIEGYTR